MEENENHICEITGKYIKINLLILSYYNTSLTAENSKRFLFPK